MKIKAVRITIEPWAYHDATLKKLQIKIDRIPGEPIFLEKILPDDDFRSLFDYIWQTAGKELKQAIEEME